MPNEQSDQQCTASDIKCCKNIATDGPFISCGNVAAYRYKNEYGDIVTFCEEHAPYTEKKEWDE